MHKNEPLAQTPVVNGERKLAAIMSPAMSERRIAALRKAGLK